MHILFSPVAATKFKDIFGENACRVIISEENCNSCFGGGINFSLAKTMEVSSDMEIGILNDINWGSLKSENAILDGTEIDFKIDEAGEYFEIYNQGHYIPLTAEQLVNYPGY